MNNEGGESLMGCVAIMFVLLVVGIIVHIIMRFW